MAVWAMGDAVAPEEFVSVTPRSINCTKNGLSTPAENVWSHFRFLAFMMDRMMPRVRSGQQSLLKNAMSTVSSTSSGNGSSPS